MAIVKKNDTASAVKKPPVAPKKVGKPSTKAAEVETADVEEEDIPEAPAKKTVKKSAAPAKKAAPATKTNTTKTEKAPAKKAEKVETAKFTVSADLLENVTESAKAVADSLIAEASTVKKDDFIKILQAQLAEIYPDKEFSKRDVEVIYASVESIIAKYIVAEKRRFFFCGSQIKVKAISGRAYPDVKNTGFETYKPAYLKITWTPTLGDETPVYRGSYDPDSGIFTEEDGTEHDINAENEEAFAN